MKLSGSQFFDINWLKGQIIINENGAEFYIKNIQVDVAKHEIYVQIKTWNSQNLKWDEISEVPWDSIKNWSIQFQGQHEEKRN